MLDGETLDYGRYCKYHCGMVGNVAIPYTDATGVIKGDRMETVYVMGHEGGNPAVRVLGRKATGRVVIRNKEITAIEKTPAVIAMIEASISKKDRQHYDDLMVEINQFYSEISAEELTTVDGSSNPGVIGSVQQQSQPSVEGGVITFGDLSEPVVESSPSSYSCGIASSYPHRCDPTSCCCYATANCRDTSSYHYSPGDSSTAEGPSATSRRSSCTESSSADCTSTSSLTSA
jgi:hypothetical protein